MEIQNIANIFMFNKYLVWISNFVFHFSYPLKNNKKITKNEWFHFAIKAREINTATSML